MRKAVQLAVVVIFACSAGSIAHAQIPGEDTSGGSVLTEKAKVLSVESETVKDIPGTDTSSDYQTLSALVLSGPDSGKQVTVENDYLDMQPGAVFFLTHTTDAEDGLDIYNVLEPDRLPALGVLTAIFVVAVILIGGWTGLRGLLALLISILLVFYALLPGIAAGFSPVLVASLVAGVIVVFGSYLTHGINRTTSAAVVGLLVTVGVTALIAHFAIIATQLSGLADETSADLNFASQGHINFVALLLGAMLIGALGILYDAAISQAVAVEELLRATPTASRVHLFKRAMRIGREHIGALVNTLAIAYVGVSLPLLLLFQSYGGEPFLQTVNREMFATEIVRAIVGSLGILLAVPIATLAAIFLLTRKSSTSSTIDSHGHHHH
jgi:uncharacterized membrane protein